MIIIVRRTTGDAEKEKIASYYNGALGVVDVVDKLKEKYSVGRMSPKWPFFLNLNK